jgi:heme exporter protein B
MSVLRLAWVVCAKDLKAEWRTKQSLNAAGAFAVTILVLFSFALDLAPEQTKELAGGLLWMVFAFAGALILNQSFTREVPNDCLDALVVAPVPASALFLGKVLANWLLLMIVELFCLPLFTVFYNISWTAQTPWLFLVMMLATWGMTVIGTMFSALTVNLKLRELMLPVLVYPMLVPALMAAMQLTSLVIGGQTISGDEMTWLRLLIGFDIIFTALTVGLIDTVLVG